MPMHQHTYLQLMENNKAWVQDRLAENPRYFEELSKDQKPPFLFIGCSDSRKPIHLITQTGPGELFIHRNIANQVSLTDMNVLSVLEFSIMTLQVQHIIVCGHHGCGGVKAAITGQISGMVEDWIAGIRDLYSVHKANLENLPLDDQVNRLSELNVLDQLHNIHKTSVMQKAIKAGIAPQLHGWIFHMNTGLIHEVALSNDF